MTACPDGMPRMGRQQIAKKTPREMLTPFMSGPQTCHASGASNARRRGSAWPVHAQTGGLGLEDDVGENMPRFSCAWLPLWSSLLGAGAVQAAQTLGPVTDDLGVVRIPKGAPIIIGGYWVISGADTAMGIDSKRGAELAFKDAGDKILGHPVKLTVEDDLCSAEGGQTAATKLAANPQIFVVLGGACSSAATPAAPILWQQGITNICNACSAPSLTAPDRGAQYDGFGRTIASDIDQGASDAKYMYTEMKAKKIVAIHDGSPYAQQLAAVAAKNFTAMGGTVLSTEAVAPTDVDMHPVLTKIAAEKPDVIYMPIFVAAAAQLLRQSKEVPGSGAYRDPRRRFAGGSGVHRGGRTGGGRLQDRLSGRFG